MAKADRAAAIAELTDKFRSSGAAVLTEYRGLTVKQLSDLRRSLARATPTYAVVKNTLTEIAAKEAGSHGLRRPAPGPVRHRLRRAATRSRRPRACVTSPRRTPSS